MNREKACRLSTPFRKQIQISIKIRLKLIECVIEPIALYGKEVWGPLAKQDFTIETLHAEHMVLLHAQRKCMQGRIRTIKK